MLRNGKNAWTGIHQTRHNISGRTKFFFAPWQEGTLQICVNYRKFNTATQRGLYDIPKRDDCTYFLWKSIPFCNPDASSWYWQRETDGKSMDETAFTCHKGPYQFTQMEFCLKNTPRTLQQAMGVILATVKWHSDPIYLDDILMLWWNFDVFFDARETHCPCERSIEDIAKYRGTLESKWMPILYRPYQSPWIHNTKEQVRDWFAYHRCGKAVLGTT